MGGPERTKTRPRRAYRKGRIAGASGARDHGFRACWPGDRRVFGRRGAHTVTILGAPVPRHSLFVIVVCAVAVAALSWIFNRTSMGRQVRALAFDRDAARLQGIAVNRLSIITFALASAMAGLAGILLGPVAALTPEMGLSPMLFAFGAAIIGGFGRFGGVVAGALLLGLAEQFGGGYISTNWREIFPFAAMLLIIAFRPEGLFGGEASARL